MSKPWSIRWWDIMAVFIALLIALFVVYYSIHKSGASGTLINETKITVRVPAPLPEIQASLQIGDPILNLKNESVAKIIKLTSVDKSNKLPPSLPLFSDQDILITLAVNGNLRLKRDLPGFPLDPASLKIGVWALITTNNVELSGMIVAIDQLHKSKE